MYIVKLPNRYDKCLNVGADYWGKLQLRTEILFLKKCLFLMFLEAYGRYFADHPCILLRCGI